MIYGVNIQTKMITCVTKIIYYSNLVRYKNPIAIFSKIPASGSTKLKTNTNLGKDKKPTICSLLYRLLRPSSI